MILKSFITCIAFAYKADVTLMRILLVLIGEASHVPPMNELEPAAGGAIDILQ